MAGSEKLVATLVDAAEAKSAAMCHLNQQLGRNIAQLARIEEVVVQLQQTKTTMQEKLEFVSTAAPDQISQAVQAAEDGLATADQLQEEARLIHQQHVQHSSRVKQLLSGVEQKLQLMLQLDRVQSYQGWVRAVQQISEEMCRLSASPSSGESELLARYSQVEATLEHLSGRTACTNLHQYVHSVLLYWHTRLLHSFSQEFEGLLKDMRYPFLSTNSNVHQPKPTAEQVTRLQLLTRHLLRLHNRPQPLVVKQHSSSSSGTIVAATPATASNPSTESRSIGDSTGGVDQSPSAVASERGSSNSKQREEDLNTSSDDYHSICSSGSPPNKNNISSHSSSHSAKLVATSSSSSSSSGSDGDAVADASINTSHDITNTSTTDNTSNTSDKSSTAVNTSSTSDKSSTATNTSNTSASNSNTSASNSSTSANNCSATGVPAKPDEPAIIADFAPLLTPLRLLLKPLEIRFVYHFSGSKKTNSPSHPEWCLTRVLSWISNHAPFLSSNIQPVLDQCQYSHISATSELSRGLVRLVTMKLSQDLLSVMPDEDLFCHSLQETLNFDREMRLQCGYPPSQPSVLVVLTQPQVLSQWLHLERKFAVAVMDELVSMTGAWSSEDEGGVSACGEQLVTLLQGITDRFRPLPQPGHRLQFLEVELDVLDEYRVRGVQLSRELQQKPVTSHYPAILNTLYHITETLATWGDMPLFLELQVYRSQQKELEAAIEAKMAAVDLNNSSSKSSSLESGTSLQSVEGSVFEECAGLYCHVQREMLATIQQHVMSEVRARFMPYRRDKWFLEPKKTASSVRCCDVSSSLCPLLEVLARQLHCLRRVLATPLFTQLWHTLARDIDKFLFEELVLQNHFSDVGAAQFELDMSKALFPMFSEFTSRPESHFIFIKESLVLLSLPLAPALLLRDTLHQAMQGNMADTLRLAVTGSTRRDAADTVPGVVEPEAALADHGVTSVIPEHALRVLNARNNISSL